MLTTTARRPTAFLVYVLLALVATLPARAGINRWTAIGPDGGRVSRLVLDPADPTVLYAATYGAGVARSEDGGGLWTTSVEGLGSPVVLGLAADPTRPGRLWAGGWAGLFVSDDGGVTWRGGHGARPPEDFVATYALAVSSSGSIFAGTTQGLFVSDDGGATWRRPIHPGTVFDVVTDPVDPGNVYLVSSRQAGVYKSTDDGATWRLIRQGLVGVGPLSDLDLHPSQPSHLLLAARSGVYVSADGGESWSDRSASLPARGVPQAVAFDPVSPAVAYVGLQGHGVYKTTDGGASWTPTGRLLQGREVATLLAPAAGSGRVYAGTGGMGVVQSTDGGARWSPASRGLHASDVASLALDPERRGVLYAGTVAFPELLYQTDGGGLFRSSDAGNHWQAPARAPAFTSISALGVDPSRPDHLYAGGYEGLARSTDRGRTWSPQNLPPGGSFRRITDFAFDPRSAGTVYAAGGQESHLFFSSLFYKTTDGGTSWSWPGGSPGGWVYDLELDPLNPDTLYAAGEAGVQRSPDGGRTFETSGSGLPVWESYPVNAVAVDPSRPWILYAARTIGPGPGELSLYKSVDGGESWTAAAEGLPPEDAQDVVVDPTAADTVYAATAAGVWVSRDGAATWQAMNEGLDNPFVRKLALDPRSPLTLYAATRGGGVYRYTPATPVDCVPEETALCLNGARFRVAVAWRDFRGRAGVGHAVPLSPDTGYFWFFDQANVELVVKVLSGGPLNGHFWVFYGALSNVEYTLTVTDTVTGDVRTYFNPSRTLASRADTRAFLDLGRGGEPPAAPRRRSVTGAAADPDGGSGSCVPGDTALCLQQERFRVEVAWTDFAGHQGAGQAAPLTADTGTFWFFEQANVELIVKVLDGRGANGHFWVFYGALSNVEYTLTVTDTATGETRSYRNPAGNLASVADTTAF